MSPRVPSCFYTKILFWADLATENRDPRFDMTKRPTMPLARQRGNAARRRIRRKKPRKAERRCTEEIHPEWLVKQAKEAKKRGAESV